MMKKNNQGVLGINYAQRVAGGNNYTQLAWLLVGAAIVGGALFFGYRWHSVSREQAAQRDLAQCLREYTKIQNGQQKPSELQDVQELFKSGYERNASSYLASYFILFQADALLAQDKKGEALELINKGLSQLSRTSPLYTVYATKQALLNIDLENPVGLDQLIAVAHDTYNIQRDNALYYLGLYYWSKNEIAQAQQEWETLVALKKPDQTEHSVWIALAEKKLEQIA